MAFTSRVSSGSPASHEFVTNGTQTILRGGYASYNSIGTAGEMMVLRNGNAVETIVNSGGLMSIVGGVASDTVVRNDGKIHVSSGGSARITEIYDSGLMYVLNGGYAHETYINDVGLMAIRGGGIASNTQISGNGQLYVSSGGSANTTYIIHGGMVVLGVGVASTTGIYNDGRLYVSSGGSADATYINDDGIMFISGIASDTEIHDYGRLNVYSGGSAYETDIYDYGLMQVSSGGIATNTQINGNGQLYVSSGGSANTTYIYDYGVMVVLGVGVASTTEIYDNGIMFISNGGIALDTVIYNDGRLNVYSGGEALETDINDDGLMQVLSGGFALNTGIYDDGQLIVSSGGSAYETDIYNDGLMQVLSGGVASSTRIYYHGQLDVHSGGSALETYINDDGIMHISNGGVASSTKIYFDGRLNVYFGGSAYETDIYDDGLMQVLSGGVASSTRIYNDGQLYVSSGGSANTTDVFGFGTMYISNGGIASNTEIHNYGQLYVSIGGMLGGNLNISSEGYVKVGNASGLNGLTSIDYVLTESLGNEAFITVENGTLAMNSTSYSVDISNAGYKDYILVRAADISMDGKSISIKRGDENVNLTIGSSSTFINGDEFSIRANNFGSYEQLTFVYNARIADEFNFKTGVGTPNIINLTNADGSASGWVGLGDAQDVYKFTATTAGTFNFSLDELTSKASFNLYSQYDKKGKIQYKKIKGANARGASAEINNILLTTGDYYIEVLSGDKGKGKANTSYNLNIDGDYFPKASVDEFNFKTGIGAPKTINLTNADGSASGWVGYLDAQDVYKFTATIAGKFDLALGALTSKASFNLYSEYDNKGKIQYKKIKSANARGTSAEINEVLLGAGNYYVEVLSGDKGKGKANTNYNLGIDGTYFPKASIDEFDFKTGNGIPANLNIHSNKKSGKSSGWVGFGDAQDVHKFTVATAGAFDLALDKLTSKASFNLYSEYDNKGKTKYKKIKSANAREASAIINDIQLGMGVYYLEVLSGDKGKGSCNTVYDLNINKSASLDNNGSLLFSGS